MFQPPNNLVNRTYFYNQAITTTVSQIFGNNSRRTGYVLINRTPGAIIYVGASIDAVTALSRSVVRLLENDKITILEIEGDDAEHELYAISSINATLEIIESLMI